MAAGAVESPDQLVYQLKTSRYSSHSILMAKLPAKGDGKRVLDVGCGDGYLAAQLAARGFSVTGLERRGGYSTAFPSTVRLLEADLERGVPEAALAERFDFILCADILEHLRRPEDLLAQLRTMLSPGGTLIASLPNSGNLYFRLNILFGRFPQHDKGLFDRTHLRFYVWSGWRELFAAAGLPIKSCSPTGIPVGLAVPKLDGSPPVRVAEMLSYSLARLWKTLFAYQFVVTARPEP